MHQIRYDLAGKAGDIWVARVRVGVAYDRHDALNNEAVYARHYKYMATMPLLHYTHLPLAESPYTYSTDYSLSLHTQWGFEQWAILE